MLHDFKLAHARYILDDELGFWVLLQSTAWFSQFFLHEYNDDRWVLNFRFTKAAAIGIAGVLASYCERQDTRYRKAVPVRVRVASALYKLAQGASLLICLEQFAIGISMLSRTLQDIVHTINAHFHHEIQFPKENHLKNIMCNFEELCCLPAVVGVIDGTHIYIQKPYIGPKATFISRAVDIASKCRLLWTVRNIFWMWLLACLGAYMTPECFAAQHFLSK